MGKKKGGIPNPSQIANKDVLQRMNFLYQASLFMQSLDSGIPPTATGDEVVIEEQGDKPKLKQKATKQQRTPTDISQFMASTIRTISRKTVLPM
jgi:ribonuclease P protein subunit RPR2